jgi:Ran GTPase-activating protein (RanGAP) involved in mRNA processing and transport
VVEYLDISGNNIGKTNHINECAQALSAYLASNLHLEHFKISWNNLRGAAGEKVIEGLTQSSGIKTVCMNNNLLGIAYEGK